MRYRWLPWLLALVILIAGIALATAPFFDLTGRAGPMDGLPGTVLDVKPAYGALLVAAGVVIGILGPVAVGLRRGWVALVAAAVAVIAGISLDSVTYEIHDGVIDRVWSVFDMRGRGPWQAAIAALVAFFASLALALTLAGSRVDAWRAARRQDRFDRYRAAPSDVRADR